MVIIKKCPKTSNDYVVCSHMGSIGFKIGSIIVTRKLMFC